MVQFFTEMIAAPALWFVSIIQGSGMVSVFLGTFMMIMVIKTLLVPVLAHSGSDRAKRSRSKED